jgi:hypothetical protein
MVKVFVSYAHESAEHKGQVLALATLLRDSGLDTVLDVWAADTRQDWYSWAIRELTDADFVVVVASRRYRASGDGSGPNTENRGVQSEAALLRELVYGDRQTWLPKVLPVLLPGHDVDEIPLFLQPFTASRYEVTSPTSEGAGELLRVLRHRPGYLAPRAPRPRSVPPERGRVVNQINGTVHGKVVQADTIEGDVNF